ncbi:cache domain-containing sensor histidine kinase [Cohnella soli]|uniref:histidine kinase n=1 Tax=Cohnella soli TaxID=425005 RepID=A0ABW0HQH7_9BACL
MHFFKWLSIRTQLIILAFATGIAVLLIIFFIYGQVREVITKNNDVYTRDMTFQIKQSIAGNSDLMERILSAVANNKAMQDYLLETDPLRKVELFYQLNNFLLNMQGMNEGIVDFVFLSDEGTSYYLKGKNDDVKDILDRTGDKTVNYFTEMKTLKYGQLDRNCFVAVSTIYSLDPNRQLGRRIGVAAVVFDAKVLGLELNSRYKESPIQFYLLDRDSRVYSSSDPSQLRKRLDPEAFAGNRFVVDKADVPEIGGSIVAVIPKNKLYADLTLIQKVIGTLLLIFGALLLILFTVIINNILYPLKKLKSFMTSVIAADLDGLKQRINLGGYVEMGIVANKFNAMLDEMDHLTQRLISTSASLYETKLGKQQSELAFMRSQINPHFLYNTLETLKGMAVDEGAAKTMGMAKSLGRIFRYSVKGADIVSLREELDIVESYVQIQQSRFSGRFEVAYYFEPGVLDLRIPKMILQPIVENAVAHGLEHKLDKGHLSIGGKRMEDDKLVLWVKDDGKGIGDGAPGEGIGISNVRNRIQLMYGAEYGLEIGKGAEGIGTEVVLILPARGEEDA